MNLRIETAAFIDFEASGLMAGSFPIEAGWAIARRGKTKPTKGGMLIRRWLTRLGGVK